MTSFAIRFCSTILLHWRGIVKRKQKKRDLSVFGDCYEYKHEGRVVRSDIGQRNGFLSGFARYYILHSDRGAQYTSDLYRRAITRYGIRQSMNRAGGRCHDNARCESMWASEFYLSTDIDNITK